MVQLIPELKALVSPARVIDKPVYSPWLDQNLARLLVREHVETLVITGGETDVCVMATVLGAIDHGFRVVLVTDAVCSGLDETHDASLALLSKPFSAQMTTLSTDELLAVIADQR